MKNNYNFIARTTVMLMCFVLTLTGIKAQCIIGAGTLNTDGSGADPIERYYNYEHFQMVYTAAELSAGGMTGGCTITGLGFSVSESSVSLANFTIDMGHTLQATANPYISTGLTNARSAFTYAPVVQAAGSFDMITFTTNFIWDGSSNIVVNTCTGSNPFTSPYGGLRYTAAANGSVRYNRLDGSSNCGTTTSTNATTRPNIRFDFIPAPACSGTPTAGTTAGPTGVCSGVNFILSLTGATTGVSGLTYQWQSSPDNIIYTNIGGATSSSASVSQIAGTYYQCIVTCTASGLSSSPSTFLNVPMNSVFTCYCNSIPSNVADEEITNVTLGSLNNSSTCATVAPGPGSIATRYGNYMSGAGAPAAATILRTNPTSFSVTVGSCGSTNFTSGMAIYMDLNQNGSFADAGEKVYTNGAASNINNIPATIVTALITIPVTANLGITAMRIIDVEGTSGNAITPCLAYTYGETEDYRINIADLPPTPPTPTQSAAIPNCSGGTGLSVAGAPALGDAWYWQTSATGTSTATPVSGVYTVFVNGTYYVRTYNATYAAWSAASSSIIVSNIPVAPLPPTPTAITPSCLSTSISVPAAGGTVTYYWQGTTSGGTSSALNASSPYSATTSGTYYVAAYDAASSCWSNTNGLAVVVDNFVPSTPTTTTSSLTICQGSASAIINASAPSSGSLTASFGTSLNSPGPATNFNITVPAIPAGSTITSTQLQIIGANSINGSWRSEIRVALSGSTTLAATAISALSSVGLVTPDPSITVPNLPVAGGPVTLTLSETYDDGGAGTTDATFTEVKLVITYTTPPSTITWWNASTAGTQVGAGSPFETVGTTLLPTTTTPGTYTFYAQAASGSCSSSSRLAIPVIVNPVLLTLNPVNITCNGGSDGSFSLGTVTCGLAPFTYSVNGGAFGAIPTNLAVGTYTIIVKDSNGDNSSSISVTLTQPSWTVPNPISGGPISVCQNASSAIISVTPGAIAVPQTITVQFALAAQPADGVSPGALIATAIMPALPAGSVVTSATLSAPSITPNAGSYQSEFQLGLTGAVSSGAAAGTGAISGGGVFNYTRPVPAATVNIAGGTINLLYYESYDDYAGAADANFVLGASSVTLTINYNPSSSITWYGASTGGTSLGTGNTLEGVGTTVLPTTATPGTYNFYAEGGYTSCTSPSRTLVTVTVNPLPVVTASTPSTVCSGSMVTLNGGGATTYVWNNGVTNATPFVASATTTYIVTGTDGNGCTNTSSTIVTVNPLPVVTASSTPILCNGGTSTVAISASGGTPAYLGEGSFTQPAGTVVYTVTDANSCAGTASVVVTEPAVLAATSTSTAILCNGGTSAVTISATGGTGIYAGTGSFTQSAGTIVYTVTDANGCSTTTSVTITQPTALMAMSSFTPISCNGGTSTVTVSGMDGTPLYTGTGSFTVSAGPYSYTVTDANGCTSITSGTITEPAVLVAGFTSSGILCNAGSATVIIAATGGTGPYLGEGSFTQSVGTITYTISDANGCSASVAVTETEPTVLSIGTGATSIMCHGGASAVTITATGGTGAYSGTGTFSQLAGLTTYLVVDANGCTASTNVTVTEPTAILPVASSTAILCNGGTSAVTISATGGTGTLTGTGSFTQSAGTIVYTVSDANGCSATVSNSVTQPTAIMVMSSFTSILCNGGTSAVTISAMDGTPPYVAGGEGTFTQSAGTIVYTVTDANSCTGTASVTITEPAAITASQTANICSGQSVTVGTSTYTTAGTFTDILPAFNSCDSTVTTTVVVNALPSVTATSDAVGAVCAGTLVTLTGGGATTYVWDNGVTDAVAFAATGTTTYIVTGTDVNSCTNTASTTVIVNPLPTVTLAPFTSPVCLQGAPITLTGGSPTGGIYSGTGVTAGVFSPSVAGVGSFAIAYIVTDVNSCSNTSSTNITVQDCTGINENVASQEVSVYPNPTSGIFNIAISNANFNELVISIVDIQGKQVFYSSEKNVSGAYSKQINLEELSKGLYYIKVSTDSEVKVQKLILQ